MNGKEGISNSLNILFIFPLQIGHNFSIKVIYLLNLIFGMDLKDLISIAKKLKSTAKKKEKIAIVANFIKNLREEEIEPAINLLLGNLPKINVGYATIAKFQKVLPFEKIPKDVKSIYSYLIKIGETSKEKEKESMLSALLSQLDSKEREFIINALLGEQRHGVSQGLFLEAIADAFGYTKENIEKAYLISSLPEILSYARKNELDKIKVKLYKPIKPMLADMAKFEDLKGTYCVEYKFDGIRAHLHIGNKGIKIFSRNQREITDYFPEIVEEMKSIDGEVILDGEIIAFKDKPLPFQELMKKFRKEKSMDIPTKLYLFDILYKDGKELLDLPFEKRREILKEMASSYLPPHIITNKPDEMKKFFEKAVNEGFEGIVAKDVKSKYRLRRGWYKVKKSHSLDVAIIAAEWGHGRRYKWLSDYWLAVLDNGKFHMVGKTFKGLTDEEFEEITKELLKNKVREEGRIIFVKPTIVVEVEFDDIQKSDRYGYALRFARVKRIRWDKDVNEINTFEDVKKLYKEMKK